MDPTQNASETVSPPLQEQTPVVQQQQEEEEDTAVVSDQATTTATNEPATTATNEPPPPAVVSPPATVSKPGKADAEAYLNDVKRQFANQPQIYHDFVDLMKSFKAGAITTQNIIEMVANLFQGFPDLIDRFNQFSGSKPPPPAVAPPQEDQVHLHPQYALPAPHQYQPMYSAPPVMYDPRMVQQQQAPMMLQQQQPLQQQQTLPQFDHAILYVTKIKKRFLHDPETYKLFLDILHTYQKESKSVNDVLAQVSELFRDHPDLLKDFAYFLPDAAQTQAKEEIQRLTARRKKDTSKPAKANKPLGKRAEKAAAAAAAAAAAVTTRDTRALSPPRGRRYQPDDQDDDMMMLPPPQITAPLQPAKPATVDRSALSTLLLAANKLPKIEEDLFAKIKAALGTRSKWGEFIRCVELFSSETITRAELIALVVDLLQFAPELVNELDRVLAARGVTEEMQEEGWFSVPLSEIDFTNCDHPTPSYHQLPAKYPKPMCSERTKLCQSVLNDTHVAVAIDVDFGSRGRINLFEDNLFKVEDDRFEMEMLIEANKSTTYALEQMMVDSTELCFQRLTTIHLKAISRMYGEEGTLECFEALKKCPTRAIPQIIDRLKTTLYEMELQKVHLQNYWAIADLKNYAKSKDHRSSTFRRDDPKNQLSIRTFLLELKEYHDCGMDLSFASGVVHRFAYDMMSCTAKKVLDAKEMENFASCFESFAVHVLRVDTLGGKEVSSSLRVGTEVWGRFGRAEVVASKRLKLAGTGEMVDVASSSFMGELFEYIPFAAAASGGEKNNSNCVVLGRSGYFFLRFYHLLCSRLSTAMDCIPAMENDEATFADFQKLAIEYLCDQIDYNKFEEKIRVWMGKQFYMMMTLDRLVEETFKAFQNMIDEDKAVAVVNALQKHQEQQDDDENEEDTSVYDLFRSAQDALIVKSSSGCAASVKITLKAQQATGRTDLLLEFPNSIPQALGESSAQVPVPCEVGDHVVSVFLMQTITSRAVQQVCDLHSGHVDWWKASGGTRAQSTALPDAASTTSGMTYSPLPNEFNESEEDNSNHGGAAAAAAAVATAAPSPTASMLSPRIKRLRAED